MNINTSKLLIFLITASLGVVRAYGSTEAEQSLETTVQPAVAITKDVASIEVGEVNPATGVHTGLTPIFNIQTNGDDNDYDFIMTSKILVDGGEYSAYCNDGSILFGHTLSTPSVADVTNAQMGGSHNKNVIAYPVNATITQPMTVEYQRGYASYGNCYVIKVNRATEGRVTHSVGGTPVAGSYSIGQDQAGTYQAVVTLTAVSK